MHIYVLSYYYACVYYYIQTVRLRKHPAARGVDDDTSLLFADRARGRYHALSNNPVPEIINIENLA